MTLGVAGTANASFSLHAGRLQTARSGTHLSPVSAARTYPTLPSSVQNLAALCFCSFAKYVHSRAATISYASE